MPRSSFIAVRVSPEERERIKQTAKDAGHTVSSFLRAAGLKALDAYSAPTRASDPLGVVEAPRSPENGSEGYKCEKDCLGRRPKSKGVPCPSCNRPMNTPA